MASIINRSSYAVSVRGQTAQYREFPVFKRADAKAIQRAADTAARYASLFKRHMQP